MSKSNTSLFIYSHRSMIIYFLVCVDDVIVTGSVPDAITQLIHTLGHDLPLMDLGPLYYFLEIECQNNSHGLVLSQRKYILDLLHKTNMASCKLVQTPMSPSTKSLAHDSFSMEDPTLYRSLVLGSLQYLLFTRPKIAFSLNRVCQYMHVPCVSH